MMTSTGSLSRATWPPAWPPLVGASPPAALDGSSDIVCLEYYLVSFSWFLYFVLLIG